MRVISISLGWKGVFCDTLRLLLRSSHAHSVSMICLDHLRYDVGHSCYNIGIDIESGNAHTHSHSALYVSMSMILQASMPIRAQQQITTL